MLLLSDIKCNSVLSVVQWGKVTTTGLRTFTYPLAFSTCYATVGVNGFATDDGYLPADCIAYNVSKTGATIYVIGSSGKCAYYFAIGT